MLLQPYKPDFILAIIKEAEAHEAINYWTLIEKSEVKNKHKNRYGTLNTILSIWYFMRKRFPDGILMKHKSRLCANGVMKQWVINYWGDYSPVLNLISSKSLLSIESIH